jgi:hypothetical protein
VCLGYDKQNKVKYGDVFFTTSSETLNEIGFSSVLTKKVKEKKNKQNKRINNFEILNSSKHLSVKDMRVRGDIQYSDCSLMHNFSIIFQSTY